MLIVLSAKYRRAVHMRLLSNDSGDQTTHPRDSTSPTSHPSGSGTQTTHPDDSSTQSSHPFKRLICSLINQSTQTTYLVGSSAQRLIQPSQTTYSVDSSKRLISADDSPKRLLFRRDAVISCIGGLLAFICRRPRDPRRLIMPKWKTGDATDARGCLSPMPSSVFLLLPPFLGD